MTQISEEDLLPVVVKLPSIQLPINPTKDQLNFWEYQKNLWTVTGRYLDYLEKSAQGLNPVNPILFSRELTQQEQVFAEYIRLTSELYWSQFQVIKVAWKLIKPDPQGKINIFDTPRTVFYKCAEDGANRPLNDATSSKLGSGKTFEQIYSELRENYKFYSGQLETDEEEKMCRNLENSDLWDWCLHCVWKNRFNQKFNPSNFPNTNLKETFVNFLKAHRKLNGFFRNNRKHFATFKWNRGYLTSSNGQRINFLGYLLNKN